MTRRLNRTWIGLFIAVIGYRVLPKRIRAEYQLRFVSPEFPMPPLHQFDTSRFEPAREAVVPRERFDSLAALTERLIIVHEQVVMDTPEDRALRARAVEMFRSALATQRAAAEAGR